MRPSSRRTEQQTALCRLNTASRASAEAAFLESCASRRWAALLTTHRPYPDLEALLAAADEAAYDLTPEDLAEALAGEAARHPLDAVYQPTHSADRPGVLAAHTALRAALAAYESRFGHTFLLCLDDRSPAERLDATLTALHSRLANEPEEERTVTAEELRRIVRGRLSRHSFQDALAVPVPRSQQPHHSGRF
ncbi:2-oxo-4-hydroxy-4-carboxy-5-ureidoimidazoline decarboxylase [Streptomyces sulphureus]|uniref:2-oxo-4-hydroxy-4-carboxy-5-ureidoimidazoline decarboxylase n=1 Tax=Streptomyces sulphureus TaxID=47758 RepID=UPI0003794F1E|nr:2-oxo-4-hydroxy-4-carboxy-5-ureidoimidazoline decarboxylase [Streptomyces sulphureus]